MIHRFFNREKGPIEITTICNGMPIYHIKGTSTLIDNDRQNVLALFVGVEVFTAHPLTLMSIFRYNTNHGKRFIDGLTYLLKPDISSWDTSCIQPSYIPVPLKFTFQLKRKLDIY